MAEECGTIGESCWVDKLRPGPDVTASVRPITPSEWYKNDRTWLSNYDIKNVMMQYQAESSFRYKFLGVFPIDFAEPNSCIYREMCELVDDPAKIKALRTQYDFIGFIINLDKHDEPGSHWTSIFMCINPSLESYGAYYYDSVARFPPEQVKSWVDRFKASISLLDRTTGVVNPIPFTTLYCKCPMQRKSTECGVFSMVFQIRWIEMLRKDRKTVFDDVMKMKGKLDDDAVHSLRKVLFRPNPNAIGKVVPKKREPKAKVAKEKKEAVKPKKKVS